MFTVAYYFSFFVFGLVMFVWEFSVGKAIPAACQFNVEFLSDIREWKLETDSEKRLQNEQMQKFEYYDHKYYDLGGDDAEILSRLHNYLNFRINMLAFFRAPRIWELRPIGVAGDSVTFKALELLPRVRRISGFQNRKIDLDCFREYLLSLIKKRRYFWNRNHYRVTIEFWHSQTSDSDIQKILKEVDPRGEFFQITVYKFSKNDFFLKTIEKKKTERGQSQQPSALAMPLTEKMGQELFHSQTGK